MESVGHLIRQVRALWPLSREEGSEGASHIDIWEKNIVGTGSSKCKGPELGQHKIYED